MYRAPSVFPVIVVLGVALAACGTASRPVATVPEAPAATMVVGATLTGTGTASPARTPPATLVVPTPAATSRGPDLQASDPEAARLDAGSLQLVEFFRFT
jgi:hypothetical protein